MNVSTDTFSTFFTLLALLAVGFSVAVAVAALAAAVSPSARARLVPLRRDLGEASVWLGWLVAATATLGSLYYSETAHFVPCQFCWYQRIFMYPLAVILLVAAVRKDRGIWRYGLPLSVIGLAISLYHYQLQLFPEQGSGACSDGVPCTVKYVEELGFASIPFMAACGFLAIFILMLLARRGATPAESNVIEESSG